MEKSQSPILRHCEERSDVAIRPPPGIFFCLPHPGGKAIPNLAKFYKTCYNILGAWICAGAASDGRRGPSFGRRLNFFLFPPPLHRRGVMYMVTYSDLFQLGILIVSIISLVIQVNNKKK